MSYKVVSETEVKVEQMSNIDNYIYAFAQELSHVATAINAMLSTFDLDSCTSDQLDIIGGIVQLSRQQAGEMIGNRELADDDEVYRILLRYKALLNSNSGTIEDLIEAVKTIFNATTVVYNEQQGFPATFWMSISAPLSDSVISILENNVAIIRPSGVRAVISCDNSNASTFGFSDLNPDCAGFGEGVFAQSVL